MRSTGSVPDGRTSKRPAAPSSTSAFSFAVTNAAI
jgi:hypothetical protein